MKNNIEQSIKESLKDYEMPYDVRAWESMSKALDQRMPVSGKSNWKWYLGGATILAIASIWFYQSSISKTDDSKNLSVTSNRVKSVHQDETSQKTSLKTTNNQSTTKDVRSTNSNLKSYSKNATANSSDKTTQLAPCYMMDASILDVRKNIRTAIEALRDIL